MSVTDRRRRAPDDPDRARRPTTVGPVIVALILASLTELMTGDPVATVGVFLAVLASVSEAAPPEKSLTGDSPAVDEATNVELLLVEVRSRAISALYVEQVAREPFTPEEWRLLELGIGAGGTAMLDIFRERG